MQHEQESTLTLKVQASLRQTFAQETALLQAQHQSDLDQIRQQNKEQQDRLLELHQRDMSERFSVLSLSLFFPFLPSGALDMCAIMNVGESPSFSRILFRTK